MPNRAKVKPTVYPGLVHAARKDRTLALERENQRARRAAFQERYLRKAVVLELFTMRHMMTSKGWPLCRDCAGEMHVDGKKCKRCGGTGFEPKWVEVVFLPKNGKPLSERVGENESTIVRLHAELQYLLDRLPRCEHCGGSSSHLVGSEGAWKRCEYCDRFGIPETFWEEVSG